MLNTGTQSQKRYRRHLFWTKLYQSSEDHKIVTHKDIL